MESHKTHCPVQGAFDPEAIGVDPATGASVNWIARALGGVVVFYRSRRPKSQSRLLGAPRCWGTQCRPLWVSSWFDRASSCNSRPPKSVPRASRAFRAPRGRRLQRARWDFNTAVAVVDAVLLEMKEGLSDLWEYGKPATIPWRCGRAPAGNRTRMNTPTMRHNPFYREASKHTIG